MTRAWLTLGLVTRLLLMSLLVALAAVAAALFLSARFAAQTAQTELDTQYRAEMDSLALAVSAAIELHHYDQVAMVLHAYQQRPGVRRVGFRDVSDTLDQTSEAEVEQRAPNWFVQWCQVAERRGTRPILVKDQYFGVVSLTLSALPVVNRAWERFTEQVQLLGLAVVLGLGCISVLLRTGLRPLTVLAQGSQALGAGDFSHRLTVQGSPEFRATFEAFNQMAANVAGLMTQVREREQHLRVTLRSIGDGVLVTDTAGRLTMMNPVAEVLTGWREVDAVGRPASEVFHIINETTRALVESPVDIVLREGRVVGLANHTVLIARDGTEWPIADSGAPIRLGDSGDILGTVLVFRDQSEEHRMLAALRASEQLYASLLDMAPVGIFQLDATGRAVLLNDAMFRILGLPREQMPYQGGEANYHPDDHERVVTAVKRALAQQQPVSVSAYRYLHPDGTVVWASVHAVPMFDDQRQLRGYVGVVVDITLEQLRLRQVEFLTRFYAALSQVNSAIVHCQDEPTLYRQVCHAVVEHGGFTTAWICRADWGNRRLKLETQCGQVDAERLAKGVAAIELLADSPKSNNLAARAVLSGERVVSNATLSDARIGPEWRRQQAFRVKLQSVAAIPIKRGGEPVAVMVIGAADADMFNDETIDLIDEIGQDLSFALDNIARQQHQREVEHALEDNEERLRLSLEISGMGMFDIDLEHQLIQVDAAAARLFGVKEHAEPLPIDDYLTHTFGSGAEEGRQLISDLRQGVRSRYVVEWSVSQADGGKRWLRARGGITSERNAAGQPSRILGVLIDITAERARVERDRMAMAMFRSSREAILITDPHQHIVMVNPAFSALTGYAADEVLGHNPRLLKSDRQDKAFYQLMWESIVAQGHWQGEVWNRHKSGAHYPVLLSISAVHDEHGHVSHYVGQATDISRQKEFEERISYLAYRDSLTDLPNRALLRDRVEQGLAQAHRDHHPLALLFLDLDHFKNINDSLGHDVGDGLLREIGRRLQEAVREMDTVGRLGGDEFLLMLPGADAEDAAHVAQKVLSAIAQPVLVGPHSLAVTPSVGIALYPKDGNTFDELLKTADTAMYRAKDEGRNAYRFFTPEMNQAVFQRLVLESNLRRAIEAEEFVLFYQPQYDIATRRLIGAEVLIRWHQRELGFVPPGHFIPVAEDCGLIEPIGAWVLRTACLQLKAWQAAGLPAVRLGINFSARQFAAKDLVPQVLQTLDDTGVTGDLLEFEITESLLATDMEHTLGVLQAFRQRGVHVAVDDFGTGYSSLSYLKRFPIDRLKIDQSFVRDLESDPDDRAIASAVVTLGHSLGMRVIAEGVENAQQLGLLREMGCDEVQGYHLGRPMPVIEMTALLQKALSA